MSDRGRRSDPRWVAVGRGWNAVLGLIITASIVASIVQLANGGAVGFGTGLVRFVSYFTIQSNVVLLASCVTLVINPRRDGRGWRVLRLDALLGIIITGIVYSTILAGESHNSGVGVWTNAGLHYVAPPAAVVGWLLFGPRQRIVWSSVAWAFVWPVLWIVYTFGRGAATGWYPYPFLDVRLHGYASSIANTAIIVVVGLILAALLRLGDQRLPGPG